jgi:hypothetical protein
MKHEWFNLDLPQLIRKTIESPDDAIATDYNHTIYELVGNAVALSSVDTENTVIEKKIVNKNSEATIHFGNISIAEELVIYLKEVQKLPKDIIDKVLKTYNDYIDENDLE